MRDRLKELRRRPVVLAAGAGLVVIVAVAFLGEALSGYDAADLTPDRSVGPGSGHWFGTDQIGHDLFSQVQQGTQRSLLVAGVAALLSTVVGTAVGVVAGVTRGRTDQILMRVTDLFLTVPVLAVLLVMAARFRDGGWEAVALVVAAFAWMPLARALRAQAASVAARPHVEAARSIGASPARIVLVHVVPHLTGPILVHGALAFAGAVLAESALSFLGFGISPPDTSLGLLVASGAEASTSRWWLFYAPGCVLVVVVLLVHALTDGLREALDPRGGAVAGARDGGRRVVDGVALELRRGEVLGVVGESGAGKTSILLGVMGLLPRGVVADASVRLDGEELMGRTEAEVAADRGKRLAMVFQSPATALSPVITVGEQVADVVYAHSAGARSVAWERALELLSEVGVRDPDSIARELPHRLSGGQRQRVLVAMALAGDPAALLLDEPTSALDVTVEAEVLALVRRLATEREVAVVLVTHDPAVVERIADRVAVIREGTLVEEGPVEDVLRAPSDPYTAGLVGVSR